MQDAIDIPGSLKVFGSLKPDWIRQPCGRQTRIVKIGFPHRSACEVSAPEVSPPQVGAPEVGQNRTDTVGQQVYAINTLEVGTVDVDPRANKSSFVVVLLQEPPARPWQFPCMPLLHRGTTALSLSTITGMPRRELSRWVPWSAGKSRSPQG